ncbi:DUF2764 family protein [Rubritalea tangerina]|uniref:DUF2764 family protein n=1 Tax=Rubritalea tangerina TaxID=430798 RepID=A0ABW4Z714_9BACT
MMRPSARYYTLVASLPHLPRIGQVKERIPINKTQMKKRFRMLSDEDREVVTVAWRFIAWEHQKAKVQDGAIIKEYESLLEEHPHPALRRTMEFRMNLRTILAGFRRRQAGAKDAPVGAEGFGGKWGRHICKYWHDEDFKLGSVYPWVREMQRYLAEGDSLKLEALVINTIWDDLDRMCQDVAFSLEHVIAFIFKWDMLDRWLDYSIPAAQRNFESLTDKLLAAHAGEGAGE